MLNTFPALLTYGFFAPTILRVAAALVFLYMAYTVYQHRAQAAQVPLPLVGVQSWAPGFAVLAYGIIGLSLLLGYYTQIGAILGAIASLKKLFWGKRLQVLFPLSRASSLLLFAICLSLLVTGAGALAFDLPL
jgi:hypothetical protein